MTPLQLNSKKIIGQGKPYFYFMKLMVWPVDCVRDGIHIKPMNLLSTGISPVDVMTRAFGGR